MYGSSQAVGLPQRAAVRSYRTEFREDGNPISEGGLWRNGRADGIDWIDVIASGGRVYGEVSRMTVAERRIEQGNLDPAGGGATPEGDYDDPTAVLGGRWGADQYAQATVFSDEPTDRYFQEVELRLRSAIEPNWCTGYEVFWRCLTNDQGYAEIARWNGRVGDFTSLAKRIGTGFGVKTGDLVEATVIGTEIKGFVNGIEVISASDEVFSDGSPGVGFNFFVAETNVDHGFTSFEVQTWEP